MAVHVPNRVNNLVFTEVPNDLANTALNTTENILKSPVNIMNNLFKEKENYVNIYSILVSKIYIHPVITRMM